MFTLALIPARMSSTRFPGKPLHPLLGIPMLGHVALRTALCSGLDAVYVATCDAIIAQYCQEIGVNVVMTSKDHVRCTDRCAEALPLIEAQEGRYVDVVVIVQGDEPLVHPAMVQAALAPMQKDATVQVVNLMAPITDRKEFVHPNTIKVITDVQGRALYFSRQPLPHKTTPATSALGGMVLGHKQVCIMPFRREALHTFMALPESPLEKAESIDMLRLLEHGHAVHMVLSPMLNQSVDAPADALLAEDLLRRDALFLSASYGKPCPYPAQ